MNQGSSAGPVGLDLLYARRQNWIDMTVEEVYIWIGILIYMGIDPEKRYQGY